jgi:hypothetical protein
MDIVCFGAAFSAAWDSDGEATGILESLMKYTCGMACSL